MKKKKKRKKKLEIRILFVNATGTILYICFMMFCLLGYDIHILPTSSWFYKKKKKKKAITTHNGTYIVKQMYDIVPVAWIKRL